MNPTEKRNYLIIIQLSRIRRGKTLNREAKMDWLRNATDQEIEIEYDKHVNSLL